MLIIAVYILGVAACWVGGLLIGRGEVPPARRLAGAALAVAGVVIIYAALRAT